MLAQHLAGQGHCVLAVDLDLESPGLGALLQGDDDLPDYGLVDAAPHAPLPILFIPELVGLDPAARRNWHEIDPSAYSTFVDTATDLILGERS